MKPVSMNSREHIFKIACIISSAFGGISWKPNKSVSTMTYIALIMPHRYWSRFAVKKLKNMLELKKALIAFSDFFATSFNVAIRFSL